MQQEWCAILMREMQEDYYLVLFMFASQLYFYVLGPSNFFFFFL